MAPVIFGKKNKGKAAKQKSAEKKPRAKASVSSETMFLPRVLVDQVRRLPGVKEGRSRVGNPMHRAWFVGDKEFAHVHEDGTLDIRLPGEHQPTNRDDERLKFRKHTSAWVEFHIAADTDVKDALALLTQAAKIAGEES